MASRILITGAAGNLGSLLSRHLSARGCELRLMYHRTPLPPDMLAAPNVQAVRADLADPATITPAVEGAHTVVHFAGRLFAPRPETFLPDTNTRWFANLVTAAITARVGRVILASFPQVEGPTSVEHPATGRLDAHPISMHAQTRLEEERLLFARTEHSQTTPVVLRFGMIYGRGILMVEAARWLARQAPLVCVERADAAPTAFDGRLSARVGGGDRQAGHSGHLPRRRRAARYGSAVPRRSLPGVGTSGADACAVPAYPRGSRVVRNDRDDRANTIAADARLPKAWPRAALGRYAARTRGADSAAVLSNVGFRTLDALIHERTEDQKIRNTVKAFTKGLSGISTQRRQDARFWGDRIPVRYPRSLDCAHTLTDSEAE